MTELSLTTPIPTQLKAGRGKGPSVTALVIVVGLLVVVGLMFFSDLPKVAVGYLVILVMLLLMALRIYISIAMILASSLGMLAIGGARVLEGSLKEIAFTSVASWSLSVIPLFVLMGIAFWRGGLAARAYGAAHQWLGRVPGGLAVATNFAGAGLAAGSGSTIGISYALGKMALPEMLKAGYSPRLATGSVAMAGTLGQIIPPSVMLVIFAGIAQTPVGPQLISGIVPGVLLAVGYAAMIIIRAIINPSIAPRVNLEGITWATRFRSLLGIIPIAVVVVIVIGGLMGGIFTATESAAFGAIAAIVVSWLSFKRGDRGLKKTLKFIGSSVQETVISTGSIFLLLIGVAVLTRVMALSGVAQSLSDLLVGWNLDRVGMMLVLIVLYLILGMFLDPLSMMLLTVPLLQGPLSLLGVDMLWFGVFLVILAEIAIVTPPVGVLGYIVHRMAQNPDVNVGKRVSLSDVFLGVLPFIAVSLGFLVLFIYFPEIVMWLPGISAAK